MLLSYLSFNFDFLLPYSWFKVMVVGVSAASGNSFAVQFSVLATEFLKNGSKKRAPMIFAFYITYSIGILVTNVIAMILQEKYTTQIVFSALYFIGFVVPCLLFLYINPPIYCYRKKNLIGLIKSLEQIAGLRGKSYKIVTAQQLLEDILKGKFSKNQASNSRNLNNEGSLSEEKLEIWAKSILSLKTKIIIQEISSSTPTQINNPAPRFSQLSKHYNTQWLYRILLMTSITICCLAVLYEGLTDFKNIHEFESIYIVGIMHGMLLLIFVLFSYILSNYILDRHIIQLSIAVQTIALVIIIGLKLIIPNLYEIYETQVSIFAIIAIFGPSSWILAGKFSYSPKIFKTQIRSSSMGLFLFIAHLLTLINPFLADFGVYMGFNGLVGSSIWIILALPSSLLLPNVDTTPTTTNIDADNQELVSSGGRDSKIELNHINRKGSSNY